MKVIDNLLNYVLKAVGALVNTDSIFKRKKKAAFNPRLVPGIIMAVAYNTNSFPLRNNR
jgi:hypothetical protein